MLKLSQESIQSDRRADPGDGGAPPTVSVIIPTFDRGAMLVRAVDSVLAQTFRDFELIIVDDASTDASIEQAKRFRDDRIRIVRNPVNLGASEARNLGFAASRGEFIAFLDSDDEWLPAKLESQLRILRSSPEVGAVHCGLIVANGRRRVEVPANARLRGRVALKDLITGHDTASMWLLRRSALTRLGPVFDARLRALNCRDLLWRLSRSTEFDYDPKPQVVYHEHDRLPRIALLPLGARLRYRDLLYAKHEQRLTACRVAHSRFLTCTASSLARAKRYGAARRAALRALRLQPTDPRAWASLAALSLGPPGWNAARWVASKIRACRAYFGRRRRDWSGLERPTACPIVSGPPSRGGRGSGDSLERPGVSSSARSAG